MQSPIPFPEAIYNIRLRKQSLDGFLKVFVPGMHSISNSDLFSSQLQFSPSLCF